MLDSVFRKSLDNISKIIAPHQVHCKVWGNGRSVWTLFFQRLCASPELSLNRCCVRLTNYVTGRMEIFAPTNRLAWAVLDSIDLCVHLMGAVAGGLFQFIALFSSKRWDANLGRSALLPAIWMSTQCIYVGRIHGYWIDNIGFDICFQFALVYAHS